MHCRIIIISTCLLLVPAVRPIMVAEQRHQSLLLSHCDVMSEGDMILANLTPTQ